MVSVAMIIFDEQCYHRDGHTREEDGRQPGNYPPELRILELRNWDDGPSCHRDFRALFHHPEALVPKPSEIMGTDVP